MSEAKRLLEQATPLPWAAREDDISAEVDGYEEFPVVSTTWATDADAALIVYAVNHLPDYLAAVEALERLGERHHSLSDHNPGSVFEMRPAFEGLPECDDYTCVDARAALARLREKVPA